ncbi:bifunctional metallophosphatase/5'-nucleotidase [Clostridium niameyense]|uniref:bifunctional metallophosphatase/5'-nucleotidase n=1 Tax=Clostridium niameyense TaxID=1622073 RepID=UPI00067E72A0|nr:bifunctional UDP-sugar hydrolase/5'-nucleotidase [Clostridium niameyense]
MKKSCKKICAILDILIVVSLLGGVKVSAQTKSKKMDILFTHDTHSHLNTFSTLIDGKKTEIGGFARIKTLINEKKSKDSNTIVLDGGDFSMGTLIQTVYDKEAAELRMLGNIGCDVTTLGNHEYDYRSDGLVSMLNSAVNSGDKLPAMVLCNVDWDSMEKSGLTDGARKIKDAFKHYGVKDYVVLKKGNVKVAVFGVFGKDALACAPTCALKFKDPVKSSKETVAKIKAKEDVDMIICVSHSGTWEDKNKSEDEILAKNVDDIDLIISGHTHSQLKEPICHGNTYIVSAAENGKYLGMLSMEQMGNRRWKIENYKLIPVTSDILQDKETQRKIDSLMKTVDEKYLKNFGYTAQKVIARNNIKFTTVKDLCESHEDHNLGNIISDSYIYAVENSNYYNGKPVDVAIVPSGTVRDTYTTGDITIEKVFNSFSLGIGADKLAGYPLINAYLTGKELKTILEIDASVSDFMTTARLYMSGLNFSYNPHRIILNKVTDCYLKKVGSSREEIDDEKLYRVVADLYSGQMLSEVTKTSYGLLSIIPKFEDGTPIKNFEDAIIMENGKEMKAWDAIARYMKSFKDTDGDGVSDVPDYYKILHNRKVVEDSRNIKDLLKNPNSYSAMIIGIFIILILVIVFFIIFIRKRVKVIYNKYSKREKSLYD